MATYKYETSESKTKSKKITIQNPSTELYIHELIKRINHVHDECIVRYEDLGAGFCKIIISSYEDIGHKFVWLDIQYEKKMRHIKNRFIYQFEYITQCSTFSSNKINQNTHTLSGFYC